MWIRLFARRRFFLQNPRNIISKSCAICLTAAILAKRRVTAHFCGRKFTTFFLKRLYSFTKKTYLCQNFLKI